MTTRAVGTARASGHEAPAAGLPVAGLPAPPPLRSPASPTSQALVAGAFVVTFATLASRMGSPLWFAAPTAALLLGIVLGLQLDLRRSFAAVPGVAAGLATVAVLTVLWAVALGWLAFEVPYALVPLAGLVVFGADWWWVERLRPATVAAGVGLVALLENDLGAALPLALMWFGIAAAALWALRRDAGRALPTPVPLDGSPAPDREPGAARTAVAVAMAWLAAGVVVALVGLVPVWLRSPDTPGRLGAADPSALTGPGSGSDGGDPGGDRPGGDIGPGGEADGLREGQEDGLRDVDGDGIPDRDIDGDGLPDVDLDGDGIPDVDADGDGVPDDPASVGPGATADPGGATGGTDGAGTDSSAGDDGSSATADDGGAGRAMLQILGIAAVVLLAAALVAVGVGAIQRERARRRALAARSWAVRLAERLEAEGARRGRARHRHEPVTRYADALATDVLRHDLLPDVGSAVSAALFGPGPPSEATGAWAVGVVDEAVAANPAPRWYDPLRHRLRAPLRRRG